MQNRKVALTQVGLSQLELHYQTLCIQADQLHCLIVASQYYRTEVYSGMVE